MRKIEKNKQFFLPLPVSSSLPVTTTHPLSHATLPTLDTVPSQTQLEEESELANTNQHKKDMMSTQPQYSTNKILCVILRGRNAPCVIRLFLPSFLPSLQIACFHAMK